MSMVVRYDCALLYDDVLTGMCGGRREAVGKARWRRSET